MCAPNGLREVVASTVQMKQGCPLSCTLFNIFIGDVFNYIEGLVGSEACLMEIIALILLYAEHVLISVFLKGQQRHLLHYKSFCVDKYAKTKLMKLNTSQAWVRRSELETLLGAEKIAYTQF